MNSANNTVGVKHDADKTRFDLVNWGHITDLAAVLTVGAAQYGDNNWQKLDRKEQRFFSAAMRHLLAWENGETNDRETGLPHLAHAAANIMFLNTFSQG